jgi:hypothetical protein
MAAKTIQSGIRDLAECLAQIRRSSAFRSTLMNEPALHASLAAPLLDAVELFTRLGIPYALIGGIAAMVYGRARFTEDIDFVAASTHEAVLAKHPEVMQACHFDPKSAWKLYHDSGVELDIWKDEHVDGIIARSREVTLAGRPVRIADVHDLIAMKLRAGRLQDDYDVSQIIKTGGVDEQVLQQRLTPEQMARYRQVVARVQAKQ